MKEIMVFIALVVCALLMFLVIISLYFSLRKKLMDFFKMMSLFPNDRWKETRAHIILMNMMTFAFGMLICSIIVFICEGGI